MRAGVEHLDGLDLVLVGFDELLEVANDGAGFFAGVGGEAGLQQLVPGGFVDDLLQHGLGGDDAVPQPGVVEGLEGLGHGLLFDLIELGVGGFLAGGEGEGGGGAGGEGVGVDAVEEGRRPGRGDRRGTPAAVAISWDWTSSTSRWRRASLAARAETMSALTMPTATALRSFSSGTEGLRSRGLELVLSDSHTPTASTMTKWVLVAASGVTDLRSSGLMMRQPRPFICSK